MEKRQTPYEDRRAAGRELAKCLARYAVANPVVVGLPRGGVTVADEVAKALHAELDVILAGKLRAPENPELAIGAVTEDGRVYINAMAVRSLRIKDAYLDDEKKERLSAMKERLVAYRAVRRKVALKGRTVIIVDDGLATGSTMISAVQAAQASGAGKIVVAVPGGPSDTLERIEGMAEVSEVVCPMVPEMFFAVSQLYRDFGQVEDDEVIEVLKAAQDNHRRPG